MKIKFNIKDVIEVEPHIEGDGIYSICLVFSNGEVLTYGYSDHEAFIEDYTELKKMGIR